MRNIVVVPHDPVWTEQFAEEAARLCAILGDLLVGMHHIGSTAIPGICAEPVFDMMPLVHELDGDGAVPLGLSNPQPGRDR